MVFSYFSFVLKGLPTHKTPRGIDAVPNFAYEVLLWSIFFICFYQGSSFCLKFFFPKWYASLPDRKKREYPSYMTCTLHHLVVVPRGYLHVYQDFMRTSADLQTVHYAQLESPIFPFIMGYLIADTLCFALPEMVKTGGFEFLLHHLMSIWLGAASVNATGHIMRCSPHLEICESANLFFNAAWITRTFGEEYKEITFVKACELIFATLFFFTRVLNLPLVCLKMYISPYASTLNGAQYTLIPIVFLQFYWFYKIVGSIFSRGVGGSKKADKKKADDFSNKEKTT
jgi:hypothetical protein